MKHYVYKLEHIDNGKYYFGSRSFNGNPKDDTYMGSMVAWNPNKSKLIKTILRDDFKTREDANEYEAKLIYEHIDNELNENYHIPGIGFHTTGRTFSHSEETKRKIGNRHRGRTHTDESKQNMRRGQLGIKLSEQTKKKISDSLKGYVKTEEHRKNLSKNNAKYFLGRTLNKEHVKKVALAHRKPIIQYDKNMNYIKEWDSIKSASNSLNIHEGSICWCCKNKVKSAGGFIWMYK